MNRFLSILAIATFPVTDSFAATVTFAPNPPGSNLVGYALEPRTVNFDVIIGGISSINGSVGGLQSIDVVVGSFGPLTMDRFVYSPVFVDNALLPPPTPGPIGIYAPPQASDLYFGGAQRSLGRPGGPEFLLGTLSVGVPAWIPPRVYTFRVDSDFDLFSNLNGTESISGVGTVIVPEPASLSLLALGFVGLLLRRSA